MRILSLADRLRVLAFHATACNKAVTFIPRRGPSQRTWMRATGMRMQWIGSRSPLSTAFAARRAAPDRSSGARYSP